MSKDTKDTSGANDNRTNEKTNYTYEDALRYFEQSLAKKGFRKSNSFLHRYVDQNGKGIAEVTVLGAEEEIEEKLREGNPDLYHIYHQKQQQLLDESLKELQQNTEKYKESWLGKLFGSGK